MTAKKIEVGQMVKGYAVLISRDGGRSQRFSFMWSIQGEMILPYYEHIGQFFWKNGDKWHYPQIELNLEDAKDTANDVRKDHKHIHIFHASGNIINIYHRFPKYFKGELVDVDHFMITEEVS